MRAERKAPEAILRGKVTSRLLTHCSQERENEPTRKPTHPRIPPEACHSQSLERMPGKEEHGQRNCKILGFGKAAGGDQARRFAAFAINRIGFRFSRHCCFFPSVATKCGRVSILGAFAACFCARAHRFAKMRVHLFASLRGTCTCPIGLPAGRRNGPATSATRSGHGNPGNANAQT